MMAHALRVRQESGRVVRAGVIGTGHYATAVIAQAQSIPQLEVPVICDRDVAAARRAYRQAGLAEDDYAICDSRRAALNALERGQRVILPDGLLLMDLPVDVVVEATGAPEASALHAAEAIQHGKHVAMVSKEADSCVGPILKYRADRAGVVYTAVDGDQHGLLMGLVQWVRDLGLEVICAGKALDAELCFDGATVTRYGATLPVHSADRAVFALGPPAETRHFVDRRREILGDFARVAGFDVVEMVIAANATGLHPDSDVLHGPVVRIPEIPEVLAPIVEGGILERGGVVDAVICLRHSHEAGLGGGVFVVVGCANDYSRHILTTKGLITNSRGTTALIYRPYHLCRVETPISILAAGLSGMATGASDYHPIYDAVALVTEDLKAGTVIGNDHDTKLKVLIHPAQAVIGDHPVPMHLANGRRLIRDISAGSLLTVGLFDVPADSTLWRLRKEQDQLFLKV